MKAVFIVYNQAHTEKVEFILDSLGLKGYTRWTNMNGRGTIDGVPHMGTHTWPEINSATLTVVSDDMVDELLKAVRLMDEVNKEVGVRAFVWEITTSY